MRTTFGTLLSKAGVYPRTAQAAMRHSDIGLTMGVYTDPKLLDVAGAVESLPALPLASDQGRDRLAATGTEPPIETFARLHQGLHQLLTNQIRGGQFLSKWRVWEPTPRKAKTLDFPKEIKGFLTFPKVGVTGFEPATSWSRTKRSSQTEPHPESRHCGANRPKTEHLPQPLLI